MQLLNDGVRNDEVIGSINCTFCIKNFTRQSSNVVNVRWNILRFLSQIHRFVFLETTTTTTPKNNDPLSGTTRVSRYRKGTRSSAIAEGPRDASCQLKSCQLPRNSAETTYTTSPDQTDGMKLEV